VSTTPLFHKLEILKIKELCQYEIGKLMCKHSKKALPSSFYSLFTDISTVHERQTRSQTRNHLYVPKCQRSIKFQGSKMWIIILHKIQTNLQKTINRCIRNMNKNFFTHALLYKLKIHNFVTKFVTSSLWVAA